MVVSFSRVATLCVVTVLSLALTGCTGIGKTKPLSFAPVSTLKIGGSGAILNALNGGILPPDAVNSLTASDRIRVLEAEYQALEKAPLGQKVAWRSQTSGAVGEVSAGTPYQVGQQNCRQYTHAATIGGRAVTGQGAACRNDDGSWTLLS
ncbi:RT0821/Lpp0805 family surface protein [Hoeflea sp. YIM 152468]|uniref:RT0821/Lpp0805 family surface protein n=1 Tax=Hoeflea sp. YIM 152468 TaxID=3031759 RepID=UPI0023DAD980|nr:RT0821/Lpp0805 family surface protein [Hoeflea sp. YIM 152468]MDF1607266.1 RT0821/Lpp0805 family surface protein [Hoeflea sp. YIM 152468]